MVERTLGLKTNQAIEITGIDEIQRKFRLTERELSRALDTAMGRGRAATYQRALRLMRAATGESPARLRGMRRVFTKFDKPTRTLKVWMGENPIAQRRFTAAELLEYRRLLKERAGYEQLLDVGANNRRARVRLLRPVDRALIAQSVEERIVRAGAQVILAELEKQAQRILTG